MFAWCSRYRKNSQLLRRAVNAEGERLEALTYADLLTWSDSPEGKQGWMRDVEDIAFHFYAEPLKRHPNGALFVIVEVSGLPTILGITPAYHFYKHPDESVSY